MSDISIGANPGPNTSTARWSLERHRDYNNSISRDFARVVKKLRQENINEDIDHACEVEANIVFNELLAAARNDGEPIRIVTFKFGGPCYDEMLGEILAAIEAKIPVTILVLSPEEVEQNNTFQSKVKSAGGEIIQSRENFEIRFPSFILVGNSRYRIRRYFDGAEAVANFNDVKFGNILLSKFEAMRKELENPQQGDSHENQ